ncbi:MAG: hypothetical protein KA746_07700 [Pyrinomonadaceae bacterium]|nr:hypothetical protein [Pyrinomonadaceae bacterium]
MNIEIPMNTIRTALTGMLLMIFCVSCETGPDLSNVNKTPTPDRSAPPTEQELSGVYSVEGANENSGARFDGTLTVENAESGYRFKWQTSKGNYNGVGVQLGDAVAVTYAKGSDGKDCGVALYKISSDGVLDGRVATWGEYTFGTERATRVEGSNFDGKYKVTGTRNYGKQYEGSIDVTRNGSGYQFDWNTGGRSTGFGIWRGDRAAIGFGGYQCSFMLYKVEAGGKLEGRWGSQRSVGFGTETAKRQ